VWTAAPPPRRPPPLSVRPSTCSRPCSSLSPSQTGWLVARPGLQERALGASAVSLVSFYAVELETPPDVRTHVAPWRQ
jgi:hypothetical protein